MNPVNGDIVRTIAHSFRIGQYTNKVYHIILDNEKEICCTNNHPFMVHGLKFIKAEDLKIGDELETKYIDLSQKAMHRLEWNHQLKIKDIYIEDVDNEPMYDFTVDTYENMLIPAFNSISSYIPLGLTQFICVHNSSIYDAIVVLANWFKTKYPIMSECETNYGAVSGSDASAMRYTHAGLSDFGYEIMAEELSQSDNIVDWIDTYKRDGTKEPEFMPAKIPILLINGSFGIGLGLTASIPSHNINEVIDITRKLMVNPNYKFCLIPDLCQACDLIDTNWQEITDTGCGSFKVRGRIETETTKKGEVILHIVSLPQTVSTSDIYNKILDLIDKKELPMVKDVYDTLNDGKPDIIIHLKPGSDPSYVKQLIWSKTETMKTVSVNFESLTLDGTDIKRYSYREYLLDFIDYRMNTKFRLYCNKLQQVLTRHHQVEAFVKVLESGELETIIAMIRKQKSTDETPIIEYIIKKCHTTDVQARFIINTNISRLTLGHLKNYKEELKKLIAAINEYTAKVTDDGTLIKKEIDDELVAIANKYGGPRLCKVISAAEENNIPAGIFKVIITERNFVRKITDSEKITIVRKDTPKYIIRIDNTDNLLLFDNKGKAFSLPVSKIPLCDRSGAGTDIRILIKNLTADIINIFAESTFKAISKSTNKHYLTVLTQTNTIKKMDLADFLNITPSGLLYSKLPQTDCVVGLALVPHSLDIVIGSDHKALRVSMKDIPVYKRAALGAGAMNTEDAIESMSVIYPDSTNIIVVTRNGKFNRFNAELLTPHKRNCKGAGVIKLDPNDTIMSILGASENDMIRIVTTDSIYQIPVVDIKLKSTIAPGAKLPGVTGQILKIDIIRNK